jgi:hypothetical protein
MRQPLIRLLTRRRAAVHAATMASLAAAHAPLRLANHQQHQVLLAYALPSSRPLLLHQLRKQENNHAATSTQKVS